MPTYLVNGPLAVIKDGAGKQRYYYGHGTSVPEDLPAEELERLEARGLLTKVDEPKAAQKPPPKV